MCQGDDSSDRGLTDRATCLRCASSSLCPYSRFSQQELWAEIKQRLDDMAGRARKTPREFVWNAQEQRALLNVICHYGQVAGNWQQSYSHSGWRCGKCEGGDFDCHSPRCPKRECPVDHDCLGGLQPVTVYIDPSSIPSMGLPYRDPRDMPWHPRKEGE